MKFSIKLHRLKKAMNQIKDAIVKNENIPVFFGENMGQIILKNNKVCVVNPGIFLEVDCSIKMESNSGICVPDSFHKYIEKIKVTGDDKDVIIDINDNLMEIFIDDQLNKSKVTFSVKTIENVNDVLPSCSEGDINQLPELFHTGITFCEKTLSKTKSQDATNFVWCSEDKIFSSDQNQISCVDLSEEFSDSFSLSPLAIKTLKNMDVNEYQVDKGRFAFFYGSGVTVGVRQPDTKPIDYVWEFVDSFMPEYDIDIPDEISNKIQEIKIIMDKKNSQFIQITESNGEMSILTNSNSIRKKNEIVIKTPSENDVDLDLNFGFVISHFEDALKIKKGFELNSDLSMARVRSGEENQFVRIIGLPR